MKFLYSLKKYTPTKIAWSLRKVNLRISKNALVLDVGSGSNPHPAADVLLEKYIDIKHRYSPLVADRPTVLADACKTPFSDKAFDFVIAFHVLEHIDKPELFLNELQRIGKAGYIETPNAIFERLHPYSVHAIEVMNINDELIINKKSSNAPDKYFSELKTTINDERWNKLFYSKPELFHVRYFWNDKIKFRIINPEVNADWVNDISPSQSNGADIDNKFKVNDIRSLSLKLFRKYYSKRKKNKVDLTAILVCPECRNTLTIREKYFICLNCSVRYKKIPIPDFNKGEPF